MVLRQCGFMVSMFFVGLIYPVFEPMHEPSRGNFPLESSYHEEYSALKSRFPLEDNQAPKGRPEIPVVRATRDGVEIYYDATDRPNASSENYQLNPTTAEQQGGSVFSQSLSRTDAPAKDENSLADPKLFDGAVTVFDNWPVQVSKSNAGANTRPSQNPGFNENMARINAEMVELRMQNANFSSSAGFNKALESFFAKEIVTLKESGQRDQQLLKSVFEKALVVLDRPYAEDVERLRKALSTLDVSHSDNGQIEQFGKFITQEIVDEAKIVTFQTVFDRNADFSRENKDLNKRVGADFDQLKQYCDLGSGYIYKNNQTSFEVVRDLQNKMSDYMVDVYRRYKNSKDPQEIVFLAFVKDQLEVSNHLLRNTNFQRAGVLTIKNEPVSLVKKFRNWWLTLTDSNFANNYAVKVSDVTPIDNFVKTFQNHEIDSLDAGNRVSLSEEDYKKFLSKFGKAPSDDIKSLDDYNQKLASLKLCINEYNALKTLADLKGTLGKELLTQQLVGNFKFAKSDMIRPEFVDQNVVSLSFLLTDAPLLKQLFDCPETRDYVVQLITTGKSVKVPSGVAQNVQRAIDFRTGWSKPTLSDPNNPRYVGYQSSYENAIKYLTKKMAVEKKK